MQYKPFGCHFPVTCHTDYVGPGSTFVAIKGFKQDGTIYISSAIKRGASTIAIEHDVFLSTDILSLIHDNNVTVLRVKNSRRSLAELSAKAHGYPAKKLKIVGITGTKGKTTTAFLLEHMLKTAGYKVALLTTVKNSIVDTSFKAPLTTPQPDYIHYFLKQCVDVGVDYVVMEVAAQALTLHRIAGLLFDGIIFTNFELEHTEFYSSIDSYFNAKCKIFEQLKAGSPAYINADDAWIKKITPTGDLYNFSLKNKDADYFADPIAHDDYHVSCSFLWQGQEKKIDCPGLLGNFNLYNVVAACSLACSLGIAFDVIDTSLQSFNGVPGRLERYTLSNGAYYFVDYAHTPSSYKAVLSLLRLLTTKLIVVFGAGGERGHDKRPVMGALVAEYADIVIITSDNPRSEDPQQIIDDVYAGISSNKQNKVIREIDRFKAIKKAYALTEKRSIIAVLGKGTEECQIIGDKKVAFSDVGILRLL